MSEENNFLKRMIREYYQPEIDRLENIIKEVREYIEEKIELYTAELTEENKNKLSYTAPIRAVYKELLDILDKGE